MTFLYERKGGNIFTAERLKAIAENDEEFFTNKEYEEDFCQLVDGECTKPRSVIRFFDGTYQRLDRGFNDPDYQNITHVMNLATMYPETKTLLEFVMPSVYTLNNESVVSSIVRSTFSFGFPLSGYKTDDSDEEEQEDELAEFLNDYISDVHEIYEDRVEDMDFYYFSPTIFQEYVTNQVIMDMMWLGGSILFIFIVMWIQTRSLLITGLSTLSIVTSFFIANMLYRVVLDFRYFGIFQVLALFIILGIGADDVFVFYDTWRESGHYSFPSLAHRLSYVFRRATLAMLWTSLTTAIAFMVSAASPFLGVNSFGVFAGLLVFVNYLSVVFYLPCVIIVHHLYFEKYCCCCCCANKSEPKCIDPNEPTVALPRTDQGIVVRFFNTHYYDFITHKVIRWVILGVFGCLLVFFIYSATQLEVQEEQVRSVAASFVYLKRVDAY